MRIKVLDDNGIERWAPKDEVFGLSPVDPDPAIFHETFSELSIEDAWAPTTGATWVDAWVKWRVRHLNGNDDKGWKVHIPGETHEIVEDGLAMRGINKSVQEGFPWTAAMISTERSFAMEEGQRINVTLKITQMSPGGHFSLWLLESKTGKWPPEIDLLEVVGSNLTFPDGPVNLYSVNGLRPDRGGPNITFVDHEPDFWDKFHTFSFVWGKDVIRWLVDNEEVRAQPNFLTSQPMYFLATWELGASRNQDFPGPVNDVTVWPFEVIMKEVKVTKI